MAITTTSDLVDVTSADTLTTNGQFYRLNGVNSGNPAAEPDAFAQGTACVAYKCGATSGTTDVGGHFNSTNTFDLTNQHLFVWVLSVTAGNLATKVNDGLDIGLTNTSTTSTTAWSTTNYKRWRLDGSNIQINSTGWNCYVLNPAGTADLSAGTLTLTTVKNVGILSRQLSGVSTGLNNLFNDAIRRGTGLTTTCSSSADTITFASIYSTDSIKTNSWGIITQANGIYYGAAKITIGATGQTNTCLFKDTNAVLVWRDFPVATSLYEFNLKGAASFKTTLQFGSKDGSGNTSDGCVIRGQGTAVWNITCDANSEFKAYSSSFSRILSAVLSSTSELKDCSIASSGTFDVNGATINGCQFSGQTASQLKVDSTSELSLITNSSFTSGGTGHAIEITVVGTYSLTNLTFNNFAATNGSTGNEAVYVSAASGSVTLNVTGGTTPSVRTAGATVTVVSGSVTTTVTVTNTTGTAIQNANVLLKAAAGGGFPVDVTVTIANSGTTATVTHTSHGLATNDKVLIKGASLAANNGVFTITKINDNSYSYTMGSTPGSNPTGTIKATFVFLYGLTNSSGQISMSRVVGTNQPVTGWARKATGSPLYKTGAITGTVNSSTGASLSSILILDE